MDDTQLISELKNSLREWAQARLNKKTSEHLSGLGQAYSPTESISINIGVYCVDKKCPFTRYYHQCNPPNLETLENFWSHVIRQRSTEYRIALEKLASATNSTIWQALHDFTEVCSLFQRLLDTAARERANTRDIVRREQEGHCIVPSCNKSRGLHLHACLPVFRGGEYTQDNCVLVCPQHHPSLEGYSTKAEVINKANHMKKQRSEAER